jgi:hypothetical protein
VHAAWCAVESDAFHDVVREHFVGGGRVEFGENTALLDI